MKKGIILLLGLLCASTSSIQAQYLPDELGPGFEKRTIEMPDDYEGPVVCTLVRKSTDTPGKKALLYVHGFNDYFFQKELANKFDSAGYQFYAVDLRKYGRSLLPNQTRFNVRNISEYFADIDTTMSIMRQQGCQEIYLMGHSTGGLITSLYADARRENTSLKGLLLNSPFFDQNESWFKEKVLIPIVTFLAKFFPDSTIKQGLSTWYGESLHKKYKGEWEYDLDKKMMQSPPLTFSWIGAIHKGQRKIHKGLDLTIPVLVLHSDKSTTDPTDWKTYTSSDAVLDINDINKYSQEIGKNTDVRAIPNGLHDLILSNKTSRDSAYHAFFHFLHRIP